MDKKNDEATIRIIYTTQKKKRYIYTNISSGILKVYNENHMVRQLSGTINDNLKYIAYLSRFSAGSNMANWDFAFFNPQESAGLETRYFVRASCRVNDYTEEVNSDFRYLTLADGVTQESSSQRPLIEGDFNNLYAFTNNPAQTLEKERDIERNGSCKTELTEEVLRRRRCCRLLKEGPVWASMSCIATIYFIKSYHYFNQ